MASLLERVVNVFDNHQDVQRERARQEGYEKAMAETRDALLTSALAVKEEWTHELGKNRAEAHAGIHARYEARIAGLNDAFTALRQNDPAITTQLNAAELRESATRQAEAKIYTSAEQPAYYVAYRETRQQLEREFAERETPDRKREFVQAVAEKAGVRLATSYPANDRDAGIRQATVDWANEQTDGRIPRPILNRGEYQAGYEAMKDTLDRKWESWHAGQAQNGSAPSKETERQMVRDLALEASRFIRENWGDRGAGPERFEDPDYERGRRKAVMDWSHEHNRRLNEGPQQNRSDERGRPGPEYGLSY